MNGVGLRLRSALLSSHAFHAHVSLRSGLVITDHRSHDHNTGINLLWVILFYFISYLWRELCSLTRGSSSRRKTPADLGGCRTYATSVSLRHVPTLWISYELQWFWWINTTFLITHTCILNYVCDEWKYKAENEQWWWIALPEIFSLWGM